MPERDDARSLRRAVEGDSLDERVRYQLRTAGGFLTAPGVHTRIDDSDITCRMVLQSLRAHVSAGVVEMQERPQERSLYRWIGQADGKLSPQQERAVAASHRGEQVAMPAQTEPVPEPQRRIRGDKPIRERFLNALDAAANHELTIDAAIEAMGEPTVSRPVLATCAWKLVKDKVLVRGEDKHYRRATVGDIQASEHGAQQAPSDVSTVTLIATAAHKPATAAPTSTAIDIARIAVPEVVYGALRAIAELGHEVTLHLVGTDVVFRAKP